jgi:hypothetical protein
MEGGKVLKWTVSRDPCKDQVKETKSKFVLGRNLHYLKMCVRAFHDLL